MNFRNLTNPNDHDHVSKVRSNHVKRPSFEFTDAVTSELTKFGMSVQTAEVALIDFKYVLNVCCANKLTPHQTAKMLLDKVVDTYRDIEGSWYRQYYLSQQDLNK